jgi:Host cell surface-exposed lipoprotein
MRTLHTNRASMLLAAGVFTALLFGSVTAGHATTLNRPQAVRAAHEYLQFEAFSLKGLVKQLKFEGYSTSDAAYGATHAGANWMNEAVKSAKGYLKMKAFSFRGMVRQLQFDGFTHAQAAHGARAVGL